MHYLFRFRRAMALRTANLQYVSTTKMGNDPRYIFARLDQKTASFTFRLNYTFTPELSLEYYGQPFYFGR